MEGPGGKWKIVVLDVIELMFCLKKQDKPQQRPGCSDLLVGLWRKGRMFRVLVGPWVGDLFGT